MAQPIFIELATGFGRGYRLCAVAAWLASALLLLSLHGRLPWPAELAGIAALLSEWPWRRAGASAGRVRLCRDGSLVADGCAGVWPVAAWTTGWLTVLTVTAGVRKRLLIASWRNRPDDYRVLRTWLRHPPAAQVAGPISGTRT